MKKLNFITTLFLMVFVFAANAQQNLPTKDSMVEKYYEKGLEVNHAEVEVLKSYVEGVKANSISCEYVSSVKKFYKDHDFVFDQLLLYLKVGKTTTAQNEQIIRVVKGRAGDRMAFNKVSELLKCVSSGEVQEDTRSQIMKTLRNLTDLSRYVELSKKAETLNSSSAPTEICDVLLALKKEADKIEPYLELLAIYYVAEPSSTENPGINPSRTVTFSDPRISEFAEKMLDLRTSRFLSQKKIINDNLQKYHCNL
jgi:hypothetical protein